MTRICLSTVATLAMLMCGSACAATVTDDCKGLKNAVVIRTDFHRLALCKDDKVEQSYSVSIGRGGVGKQKEGDNRTPLGSYALGMPRASTDFVIFIPIGYPTAPQRQAGYTGGSVGIHGPKRGFGWLGGLLNFRDWTRGCIAVNRAEDIHEIAAWVNLNHPPIVEIRGTSAQ